MDDVKNRLAEALEIRGLKQVELAERTGIAPASINSWSKNRWQPKQNALCKMAKTLNVSELWLAGYDVPMDRPAQQIRMDNLNDLADMIKKIKTNDERYSKLIRDILDLNEEQLTLIENMIKQFK